MMFGFLDEHKDGDSDVSSVVGILFLVAFIVCSTGWLFYAYKNPHTSSGQCFIRVPLFDAYRFDLQVLDGSH